MCCFFQSYQFDPDVCARLQNITQHGVIWSSFTTYHVKIFILMISIMGVDQKASGVQFCWCFYILILIYTVKYFYFYGDVLEFFSGTSWCFFYILFCDSIYFLHSYYCCVIVEFLLPFSCLNEISVPTSLSICVLRAWCPIRMEPIKYYLFFIELWKQGHQMYQFIGEGGVIIMCASICICANVYMVLYIPCPSILR